MPLQVKSPKSLLLGALMQLDKLYLLSSYLTQKILIWNGPKRKYQAQPMG